MSGRTPYARVTEDREWRLSRKLKSLLHGQLLDLLHDTAPIRRRAAARALAVRNNDEVFKDCMKLCRSDNPVSREYGAMILGLLHFPDTPKGEKKRQKASIQLHALVTGDSRILVRAEAMRALAICGAELSIMMDAVNKTACDGSASVRVFAAFAIGLLDFPGAETALLQLLHDTDRDVRDWAAFAAFQRTYSEESSYDTPEIRDALLYLTRDSYEKVRFEAFRALGMLREKRAVPALIRELGNEEYIFYEYVEVAGQLGDPSLIPVLETALERFGDDEEGTLAHTLESLRR